MGTCSRCHRPLKDPTATIGPVCATKLDRAGGDTAMRASYSTEIRDEFVLVIDHDQGKSVTNDAENVIADLYRAGLLATGRRVLYRDTDGRWDELRYDGVRFTGFGAIGGTSPEVAIARARAAGAP